MEDQKILSLAEAQAWRSSLAGRKLVVTNGVFDMLHPGHAQYLADARAHGDYLLVAMNSDASVQALKGPKRPVVDQVNRAFMLSALSVVDKVVVFEDVEALETLRAIAPDIYIKGGDYTLDTINQDERRALESLGTSIEFVGFRDGFSTTLMIDKIIKAYGE